RERWRAGLRAAASCVHHAPPWFRKDLAERAFTRTDSGFIARISGTAGSAELLVQLTHARAHTEAETGVDGQHVRVRLGVERVDPRGVGGVALQHPQVLELDAKTQGMAAIFPAHQRAPLVGVAVVARDDDLRVRGD